MSAALGKPVVSTGIGHETRTRMRVQILHHIYVHVHVCHTRVLVKLPLGSTVSVQCTCTCIYEFQGGSKTPPPLILKVMAGHEKSKIAGEILIV